MAEANLKVVSHPHRSPVRDVQDRVRAVESSHDETIAGIGDLVAGMARFGAAAKVGQVEGQQALDRVVQTLVAAARMRALVIAAHQDMREAYGTLDLRELGFGAMDDSPDVAKGALDSMIERAGAA